jgi:4-hydroxy-2-oxoheptanedioate aldolase
MNSELSLKQRIHNGDIIVALRPSIAISRGQLEDALSKGAYDLIYLDGQHSAFSDDQLVSFCAMAEDLGLPVQFRIPHTRHTYLIGRYLDMGLSAILAPEVAERAAVEEAIAYSYYPQIGRRSWGGAARHGLKAHGGAVDRLTYAEWWNNHVVLAIQLESVDGIVNAHKLALPGVDYVAFGPNDLQFNLEGHPDFPLRTPDDCMRNVAAQLKGSGIRLGMAVITRPDERDKYLEMGITLFQEAPGL